MNQQDLPWLFPPAEGGFSDKAYSCGTLSRSFLPGNHARALHISRLCLLAVWIAGGVLWSPWAARFSRTPFI